MTDKIKIKWPGDDAFAGCTYFDNYEVDRDKWEGMTGVRYEDWEAFLEYCAQTQDTLRQLCRVDKK